MILEILRHYFENDFKISEFVEFRKWKDINIWTSTQNWIKHFKGDNMSLKWITINYQQWGFKMQGRKEPDS